MPCGLRFCLSPIADITLLIARSSTSQMYAIWQFGWLRYPLASALPRPLTPIIATVSVSPVDLVTWACDWATKYEPDAQAEHAAEAVKNERRDNGSDVAGEFDMVGLQAEAGWRFFGGQSNTRGRRIHPAFASSRTCGTLALPPPERHGNCRAQPTGEPRGEPLA